jgi:outer membrane receptor for ferrienterochelin and colicin
MIKKNITSILLLLIFIVINGKENYTFSGFVKDSVNNEALIGAYIIDSSSKSIVTTNNYGYFAVKSNKLPIIIEVSYLGYASKKVKVINTDTIVTIKLCTNNFINDVVVLSSEHRLRLPQTSIEKISSKELESLPVILGESDITRTIQLLPGVVRGSETTTGYFVRGGNSDQNLILIDGAPVYNAYHMFGMFSAFNSDAINNAKFYKGGIPAQYGNRLSSVLDLSMREGTSQRISGEIMLGTFSSKFLIEGPIYNNKTTFLITGRRSILDISPEIVKNWTLFLSGMDVIRGDVERIDLYSFYDINAKVNHSFSDRCKVFVNLYKGVDNYDPRKKTIENAYFKYGNKAASIRCNYLFHNNIYGNFTVYYSNFDYSNTRESLQKDKNENVVSGYSLRNISGIEDYSVKADFDYALHNHNTKFGLQYINQKLRPGVYSYNNTGGLGQQTDTTFNYNKNANQFVMYVSDFINPVEKFSIIAGLRSDIYFVDKISFLSIQPRFTCSYLLLDNLSMKASYTRATQFIHLLSFTSSGAPSDIWVPSTKNVAPSNSHEFVVGTTYQYDKSISFNVEGFYKIMDNLIMYKEGASYVIDKTDWQNMIEIGKGKSKGIEIGLKKEKGKTTGWISYTLSKTTRQFDMINLGREFPFTYDRTHNIAIALIQKLGKRFEIGADWIYATGNAVTLSNTYYYNISFLSSDGGYNSIHHFESINGQRMPDFHRLDLCLNYSKIGKNFTYKFSIGAYNVYAHQNPYYIIESPEGITKVSLFKTLPYLSLSIKL